MEYIQTCFNKSFIAGVDTQEREHNNEKVDGRAIWGELEKQTGELKDVNLTNMEGCPFQYNPTLNRVYEEMNKIIKQFGMIFSEYCPKSNHFFMQLQNLVIKTNFNIQLNRVMQLGFNIGQLSIFIKKNTLCEDRRDLIKNLVEKYNLTNIDAYITKETQDLINTKYFNKQCKLVGGRNNLYYKNKYIKYKNKYLHLHLKN